jgi:hypothetical protein
MQKSLFVYITILISIQGLYSDSRIKEKSYTESYYYGGVVQPAEESEREIWIGQKKLCSINDNWKFIVDINQNLMVIINREDSSYVECSLPFEWSKIVSPKLVGMLKSFETKGSVTPTGNTKKIDNWECQEYEVNSYILYQGSKINENDTKIWASVEVLTDNKNYAQLISIMRKFANYDSSYIQQLGKITGYHVSRESFFYPKGFSVASNQKIIEVKEIDPPAGLYEIPAGYSKKESLSLEEIRNL